MRHIKFLEGNRTEGDEWAGALNDGYSLYDLRKIALYIIRPPDHRKGEMFQWIGKLTHCVIY